MKTPMLFKRTGNPVAIPSYHYDVVKCIVCSEKKAPRVMDPICDDCIASGYFLDPDLNESLRVPEEPPVAPDLPPRIVDLISKMDESISFMDPSPVLTQQIAQAVLTATVGIYQGGMTINKIAEGTKLSREEVAKLLAFAKATRN